MVWAFHMLPAQGTASAQSVAGGGVKGYVNGSMLFVGRQSWVQQQVSSQGSSSLQHPPDSNVSAGACVLSPDPGCSAVWVGGKVRRQLFCLVSLSWLSSNATHLRLLSQHSIIWKCIAAWRRGTPDRTCCPSLFVTVWTVFCCVACIALDPNVWYDIL